MPTKTPTPTEVPRQITFHYVSPVTVIPNRGLGNPGLYKWEGWDYRTDIGGTMRVVPDPAGKYGDVIEYELDEHVNYNDETRVTMGFHGPPIRCPCSAKTAIRFSPDFQTQGTGFMNLISLSNQSGYTAQLEGYSHKVKGNMALVLIDRNADGNAVISAQRPNADGTGLARLPEDYHPTEFALNPDTWYEIEVVMGPDNPGSDNWVITLNVQGEDGRTFSKTVPFPDIPEELIPDEGKRIVGGHVGPYGNLGKGKFWTRQVEMTAWEE